MTSVLLVVLLFVVISSVSAPALQHLGM